MFERVGDGGREPAAQLAAGESEVRGLAVLDDLALLLLAVAPVVARVEVAVAHVLPAPRLHGLQDLGIHFDHRHRQRHGAAHAVLVQDLEHAPQADAVAVVAAAIAQHVGMRHARPGIAHPHLGREIFVVLDVWADPDRDPRAVGPGKLRSLDDGGVAEPVGIHFCALAVAAEVHHALEGEATGAWHSQGALAHKEHHDHSHSHGGPHTFCPQRPAGGARRPVADDDAARLAARASRAQGHQGGLRRGRLRRLHRRARARRRPVARR